MAFDWKNPDYIPVFDERTARLHRIRANPSHLPALKTHYKANPAQFISDWGCTTDPRNLDVNLPVVIPFILFPRQVEWIEWVMESWRARRPGVTAKSRESGVSWMAIALSCTLCLFNDYMVIGFGSRKAEFVDKLGAPKSLFWKAREFMALLPKEFRGNWTRAGCPEMLIKFPDTGSVMQGEVGDGIGRGDRSSLYFVDEAAHLEHPELADSGLLSTTNCRMDVSTARGLGNPFHRKVTEWPAERVFRFHWTEDPRKDDAWYQKQIDESDPVTIAQEIDIDFAASVEGVLIPSAWVMAAVDAHVKLGIEPTGARSGALDVADEGKDTNAFCGAHGIMIDYMEEWSGKGSDIFGTVNKAFGICAVQGYPEFRYDADGLGAGVRGDARIINQTHLPKITVIPFRGSEAVHDPEGEMVKGRKNKDFFANAKAQSWWSLRERFQRTHRWLEEGVGCNPDSIISIPKNLANKSKLVVELSQPTYTVNQVGKIVVDKKPNDTKSPNLADAVMIRFCVGHRPMRISGEALLRLGIRR